ncbi:MAG TPA: hypothetical protein VK564_09175 [Thermodesulfobacteriota bacterium]|nr:hypothetical protein [Thermodesulfobacteriota bacterium]
MKKMIETNEGKRTWKQKFFLEMTAYWINVAYLTILFTVFTSYRRLILAQYDIGYSNWGISFMKAMVLGKVVMVGGFFRLDRGLENKPLIFSTLSKSFLFTLWVGLFSYLEAAVKVVFRGEDLSFSGALNHLLKEGPHEFFAKCLVVFVAFIPFFAFKELGRVFGKGVIWNLFFRKGPGEETKLGPGKP